jgi:hypothetical protein
MQSHDDVPGNIREDLYMEEQQLIYGRATQTGESIIQE